MGLDRSGTGVQSGVRHSALRKQRSPCVSVWRWGGFSDDEAGAGGFLNGRQGGRGLCEKKPRAPEESNRTGAQNQPNPIAVRYREFLEYPNHQISRICFFFGPHPLVLDEEEPNLIHCTGKECWQGGTPVGGGGGSSGLGNPLVWTSSNASTSQTFIWRLQ